MRKDISEFNNHIRLDLSKIHSTSNKEEIQVIFSFLRIVRTCISGFLIKVGYDKLNKDRLSNFFKAKQRIIDDDELIELRFIGKGTFSIYLNYFIEEKELVLTKKTTKDSNEKLIKREKRNYWEIDHTFICKYYGITKKDQWHCH